VVNHCLSSLLTWNHITTIKTFLTWSFCKTAKYELNPPDAKILLYNVQDVKITANQSHLTALNVVDRLIHNPVGKPGIPQLNVSFAAEAIQLIIKVAPYIVN
jgi:hypothetical protein